MTITVEIGDPHHPQAKVLLEASHALMQSLYPAESNHALSVDDLCIPGIKFYVAKEAEKTLGCIALALKGEYGEIKSMFVDAGGRGKGIADKLVETVEIHARDQGFSALKLETGSELKAACKLYEKHGFQYCGPFGEYPEDPLSLFMEKVL